MKRLAIVVAATAVIASACDRQLTQPLGAVRPAAVVLDGAHGGNPNFFFLPPLVANPSSDPNFGAGTFNRAVSATVEVCTLAGDPRLVPTDCDGSPLVFGPAPAELDAAGEQYRVNWDTKSPTLLDATKFYRITVRGAPKGAPLGLLDVDPVLQGIKNLRTGDIVLFPDGRTLPIKVRIEQGAFGATNPDHVEQTVGNAATVVTTSTGFAGASFPDGWLPLGALAAGIDHVVVIIERIPVNDGGAGTSCLRSGLLEREGCYRFRTDPDLHGLGAFTHLVTAGVCFESPSLVGQSDGPPVQLARRVEIGGAPFGPTFVLPETTAPFLTCDRFGPTQVIGAVRSGNVRALAAAGWRALMRGIGRLVTPAALHAVDLGAGGGTDGFSRIGWARSATMTKVLTTDLQVGAPNAALATDPQVCLTYTHHSGPEPLVSEPVTFAVVTGGGTVGGGSSTIANTGSDGCAHASWVLGPSTTPGGNTLSVTALADGSPQTFTATGVSVVGILH